MRLRIVVLPLPDGPTSACVTPRSAANARSSAAARVVESAVKSEDAHAISRPTLAVVAAHGSRAIRRLPGRPQQ